MSDDNAHITYSKNLYLSDASANNRSTKQNEHWRFERGCLSLWQIDGKKNTFNFIIGHNLIVQNMVKCIMVLIFRYYFDI